MTEDRLVSVIIAVYNVEDYLVRCIDSVRNQTYQNLEIILVDDGSTDRSALLCDCYSFIDSRIYVIHKKNSGLSSARNAGLKMATGEYIYFLDSDDYIEPQLLERTIQIMENTESSWCGFRAIRENMQGEKLYQISFIEGSFQIKSEEEKLLFLLGPFLNYLVGWEACFHIYRRDIIEKYRLQFINERAVYAEDLLFSLCYLLHIEKVVIIPDVLYHYTERENSLTYQSREKNIFLKIHHLSEKMYQEVCSINGSVIKNQFYLIYLLLMEWHAREYILKYGIAAVKKSLMRIPWREYIPKDYFVSGYQEDIRLYGFQCGVITIVIPLIQEQKASVTKYVNHVLQQSIQRLDIMILCKKGCDIKNIDCRIRYIYVENVNSDVNFQLGFKWGYGEYIFFANIENIIDTDFLRKLSDAMKYNQCDTGLLCKSIYETEICDNSSSIERKRTRLLLKNMDEENKKIIFRKSLLKKSGLGRMERLKHYETNMILSGKTLFLSEE